EDFFQAINGQLLNDVDILATAVVTLAGVPFRILVGELRALGLHDGRAGVVFGSDQLDVLFLALVLFLNGGPKISIDLVEGTGAVKHGAILALQESEDAILA